MAKGKPFEKGEGGRPKGSRNKFTKLKEDFLGAFEDIGGRKALADWAGKRENQGTFYKISAQLFPKEIDIKADVNNTGEVGVVILPEVKEKKKGGKK